MVSRGIACVDCLLKCERSHGALGGFFPVDRFFKIMFGNNCSHFLVLKPKPLSLTYYSTVFLLLLTLFLQILAIKFPTLLQCLPPGSAKLMKHLTNLETQIEDVSGQRWSVTMSLVNGSLAFERGWEKFFVDHGLKVGELVTFQYIEGSHFTVRIFGTSGRERTNFDRQCKKHRRDHGIASEDELILAPRDEFRNCKPKIEVENDALGVSKLVPIPEDIVDPICMINKNDWYHEERRISLYDLSFEIENRTSDASKCEGGAITMLDPLAETEQHYANLDNASGPELSISCNRVLKLTNPAGGDEVEKTKTTAEDAQVVVTKREISDEIRKKMDDTQVAPLSHEEGIHSGDGLTTKFCENLSDNSEMKKCVSDNVCSFQDVISVAVDKLEPVKVYPSTGSTKIVEREEVPVKIVLAQTRRLRMIKPQRMKAPMIIYLRGSVGGLWPVVYREYVGGGALTANWTEFCKRNSIKPGDKCSFEFNTFGREVDEQLDVPNVTCDGYDGSDGSDNCDGSDGSDNCAGLDGSDCDGSDGSQPSDLDYSAESCEDSTDDETLEMMVENYVQPSVRGEQPVPDYVAEGKGKDLGQRYPCNWEVKATFKKRDGSWSINSWVDRHCCMGDHDPSEHVNLTSSMIALCIRSQIENDVEFKPSARRYWTARHELEKVSPEALRYLETTIDRSQWTMTHDEFRRWEVRVEAIISML
ncbi:hypothetical protein SASPL_114742 [Salvia splendens]|uniref:TF-B3 domain-containing protein n=1 Tax=Salvia splendens TaxID=180675 RepID=A0A8X8Y5C3_SALSN|nr:hypothetical protein SASPL_114742 [Salvia splendens]